ncbi:hypothetical protein TELCIR_21060, partial [Teladorsagia circumcincta]
EPVMLVMELVDGGSLDSILRKKADDIPLNDLLRYAFGAAKGLEYLHDNDCIHRDVAARNCLVNGDDVKISDFGLSHSLSNREKHYKLKVLSGYRLPPPYKMPKYVRIIMQDHCFPTLPDERWTMTE